MVNKVNIYFEKALPIKVVFFCEKTNKMEEIYPVKWFGASERFPLKSHAEEYKKCVTANILQTEEEPQNEIAYFEQLKSLMNVDLQLHDLKSLSEACR